MQSTLRLSVRKTLNECAGFQTPIHRNTSHPPYSKWMRIISTVEDGQMPFIGFVERDNPSVDMALNLLSKMDSVEEPRSGYGFVATVSMYLPNHLHNKNILYSPLIVKAAP